MKAGRSNKTYQLLAAAWIAAVYLACEGNPSQEKRTETQADTPVSDTAQPDTPPVLTAAMKAGKAVYEQNCATCHQVNGKGVSGLNPPLAGTDYVTGDQARLIGIVLKGSNVGLEINGQVYSNAMPAHAFLSDEDIANVLSYVRNSFGNQSDTVATETVAKIRATL